jgi:uncharacterized membrane protein YfcA
LGTLIDQTVFDGGAQLAGTIAVFFLSQVVYSLYGFGAGMLAVAVLAFLFHDLADVVVLLLFTTFPTEAFVVWRDRAHVAWRELAVLLPGVALGAVGGTLLLDAGAGERWLFPALGAVLVLVAAYFLMAGEETRPRALPRGSASAAGVTSGVLGGLFGMGGPPVIIHLRVRGLDRRAFRASLLAIFLATGLVRLPTAVATGLAGRAIFVSALLVIPAGLAGLAIGHRLHLRVSERRFRQGVAVLLGLLGVLLLVRG